MKWNPDQFLENLYLHNIPKLAFQATTKEQWSAWREELAAAFTANLGGFPENKVELNPSLLEEVEYEDYTRQRVEYTTLPGLTAPAYVLIPKNGKKVHSAVVAVCGHGYGCKDIVGLNPDGSDKTGDPGYEKNFAVELVKRGFLVIAPEVLGFGDRRMEEDDDKEPGQSSCYSISTYLLMLGQTIAGIRIYETIRTLDYLAERDDVDQARIGCMGISGGGLICAFASALDERIQAAVVSGYTNTFKASVMSIHHCIDNFLPGVLQLAEMPDLIGLIAPRPLLIEGGTEDPIFPLKATLDAYEQIHRVYKTAGVEERLDKDIFEGGHQIHGEKAYSWLQQWLME